MLPPFLLRVLLLLQLHLSSRYLQQYHPTDLATLLAHCANLPPNCWPSKHWTVTLMVRLRLGLTALNPSALALTAWALGRMGLKLRADFADALLGAFKSSMQGAGPKELALLVHGLAGCQCRPDGVWVGVYLVQLQEQLSGFKACDLAMMLGALVKFR